MGEQGRVCLRERMHVTEDGMDCLFFDILLSDDVQVGSCSLRLGEDICPEYEGNIGYFVQEEYRGKGIALSACRELMKLALRYGAKELLITCAEDNRASRRVCEKLGAEYLGIKMLPVDHALSLQGQETVCAYRIRL